MLYPSRQYRARRRQAPGLLLTLVMAYAVTGFPVILQLFFFNPLLGPVAGGCMGIVTMAILIGIMLLASELQRQLDCPMREGSADE